jgi:hypothetical protein
LESSPEGARQTHLGGAFRLARCPGWQNSRVTRNQRLRHMHPGSKRRPPQVRLSRAPVPQATPVCHSFGCTLAPPRVKGSDTRFLCARTLEERERRGGRRRLLSLYVESAECVDSVGSQVAVECLGAVLSSLATFLDAAKGSAEIRSEAIDADASGFDPACQLESPLLIGRPD